MAGKTRDWQRLAESYSIIEYGRLRLHEGRRTPVERINHRILMLKFQFLPHYFSRTPKWRLWLRSFGGLRTLPDFACIGPIKSGTSDLSTYLFQHPSIIPPLTKEIMSADTQEWLAHYPTAREKADVERETGKALSGYFAPLLHHLPLIDGYRAARPDAKIILMLRNPVDRAYSHYKWDLFLGGKRQAKVPYYGTFADYVNTALDLFPVVPLPSRCGFQFLQTGIYVKPVELWIDRFGKGNVHILRAEDFFADTPGTVCAIHEFLGLPALKPDIHEVVNRNPLAVPPADEEARDKLREFYRPWNEKLYALLGRDLNWD